MEASEDRGKVTVQLHAASGEAIIRICDEGKGIPQEVLPKLGTLDFSYDKPAGTGNGLYFVKNTVESWDGTLTITSNHSQGTTILIRLPLAKAPAWFVPEIKIPQGGTVVILDDAPTIHQVWNSRIRAIAADREQISILNLSSATEMTHPTNPAILKALKDRQTLYLCDYELREDTKTGLDIILELGIAHHAILVTSHSDDLELMRLCEQHKIRVLPKI